MSNSIFDNSSIMDIEPMGGTTAGMPLFYSIHLYNGTCITINEENDIETLHKCISEAFRICRRNGFNSKICKEIVTDLLREEGW